MSPSQGRNRSAQVCNDPPRDMQAPGLGRRAVLMQAALVLAGGLATPAHAAGARELTEEARRAAAELYAANPKAAALGRQARAVLMFPKIVKAGALVGGLRGEGVMLRRNEAVAFYTLTAATYGLQLGAQRYGYALFFMTDKALDYLEQSSGWSVGSGLSVVFVDEGMGKTLNTTTLTQDVYAVVFGQRGMMVGSGLEGARIRRSYPEP